MSDRRVDVTFMIYGSYGVTGSLIVREALRRGHRPLLAGRDVGKLAAQADPLGLRWVAVDLGDRAGLERALRQVSAVLLVAGPFATTGRAMVEACIATGTSYVDTNGELDFFVVARTMSAAARDARATLVSGAGFGVTAADCLALHVAQRLPDARSIEVAVAPSNAHRSVAVSLSTLAVLSGGGAVVRDGRVVRERIAEHTRRVEVDGAPTRRTSSSGSRASTSARCRSTPRAACGSRTSTTTSTSRRRRRRSGRTSSPATTRSSPGSRRCGRSASSRPPSTPAGRARTRHFYSGPNPTFLLWFDITGRRRASGSAPRARWRASLAVPGAVRTGLVPSSVQSLYSDGTPLQHWPNHDNHIHVRVREGAEGAIVFEPFEAPSAPATVGRQAPVRASASAPRSRRTRAQIALSPPSGSGVRSGARSLRPTAETGGVRSPVKARSSR